jgi:hypothetical protein
MAERRMFTNKIIGSDAFLEMPFSTQALYVQLNMNADDDVFVNNPRKIQRSMEASEDDLQRLIDKRYILSFDGGLVVIKHWRMHNTLRKDRYKPTQYIEQREMLEIKDNGSYTEKGDNQVTPTWQPSDNHLAPQYSIDKNSIDKVSGDKVSLGDGVESQNYGKYNNVELTDEEYIQLQSEFPSDFQQRIENLSFYLESTGKTYQNHLATIRYWAMKDKEKQSIKETQSSGNPFLDMLQDEGD